jgi:hypothetical protein
MKTLLAPLIVAAGIGLALSVVVHLTAVAGIPNPLGGAAWILHPGIFVVWLPAVLASRALTRDAKQGDFWRVVLPGCPPRMRYLVYGFLGYAVVNFAMFILGLYGDRDDQFASLRGFSGHWMVFYVAALAMLSSYVRADTAVRRCVNGHSVSPTANYCEICGQPIERHA